MDMKRRGSKASSRRSGLDDSVIIENKSIASAEDLVARDKAFSFLSDYQHPVPKQDKEEPEEMNDKPPATFSKTTSFPPERTSEEKQTVAPSYKTKKQLKSVLIQSTKVEVLNVNEKYNRTRRYDSVGKYRIGPSFITKARLAYLDENKPAKLSVVPEQSKSLEFGLLTYLATFTDQHDKQEIDLSFLQSLVDSGVDINYRDEHGQTLLHALVRDWHPDVVLFAIRNNSDVNIQDKIGRSPLHLAAAINCVDVARLLLLNGGM